MMIRLRKISLAAVLGLAATMALAQQQRDTADPTLVAGMAGRSVRVGEQVDVNRLHRISRPGLYGINHPPEGSGYGVIDGRLIRYDVKTMHVQSIIREVDEILD